MNKKAGDFAVAKHGGNDCKSPENMPQATPSTNVEPVVPKPSADFVAMRRQSALAAAEAVAPVSKNEAFGATGLCAVACLTNWNVVFYWLSGFKYLLLEGRQTCCCRCMSWHNWTCATIQDPSAITVVASIDELCAVVSAAAAAGEHVRVTGAGHSFNEGVFTDGRLVSLDRWAMISPLNPTLPGFTPNP